jgi:hypothetical protein
MGDYLFAIVFTVAFVIGLFFFYHPEELNELTTWVTAALQ